MKLKATDKLSYVLRTCLEGAAYIFIFIVIFYILLIVLKGLGSNVGYYFNIQVEQMLDFAGTIFAGMLGVGGGILAAKAQVNFSRDLQKIKLQNYMQTSLLQEIKFNNNHFVNCYNRDDIDFGFDKLFKLSDWEKIKYDMYILGDNKQYKDVISEICELYTWLERANQLTSLKIHINNDSIANLRGKIKNSLINTIDKMSTILEI